MSTQVRITDASESANAQSSGLIFLYEKAPCNTVTSPNDSRAMEYYLMKHPYF